MELMVVELLSLVHGRTQLPTIIKTKTESLPGYCKHTGNSEAGLVSCLTLELKKFSSGQVVVVQFLKYSKYKLVYSLEQRISIKLQKICLGDLCFR